MHARTLFHLTLGMIGAVSIASCSQNSITEPKPLSEKAIRFAVTSPSMSRSLYSPTTTETLTEFAVYGYTYGVPFMQNVDVKKTAENTWEYSPVVYWPGTPVDFYAFSPITWDDMAEGQTSSSGNTVNPGQPVDYYDQYGYTDLLYAVSKGLEQTNQPVMLNFRHALSQVLVQLKTAVDSDLDIKVVGVSINGIKTSGSFTFPSETTAPGGSAVGTWSNQSGEATYIYFLSQDKDLSDAMALTSTPQDATVVTAGFLVPQSLGTFTLSNSGDNQSVSGDYIAVDCVIYSKLTGEKVWPNADTPEIQISKDLAEPAGTGRIFFPLLADNVISWKPGVKYIYTVTVGEPGQLNEIQFGAPTVDQYTQVVEVTP